MADATPTATPASFPEGDPRNAKYAENLAALEHAKGKAEAEDQRQRAETESQYKYNTEQLQKQEPLALKANTNRANTEGLLQSGILAGRQGQTQVQYQNKEHSLAENRRKAIEQYNRNDQTAQENYEQGKRTDLRTAEEEAKRELLANPPQPPGFQPINPNGIRTVTGPPRANGVQPYEETSSRGFVRVGGGPGTRQARQAAARRVVRR